MLIIPVSPFIYIMALRNQPYLPLFVQDYLTDEKLNECSPATQGVYIKIMCLMHKSQEYGVILLKQKHKQNESDHFKGLAKQFKKHLTFDQIEIESAIRELVLEGVCDMNVDGNLSQKRMIKDCKISTLRAENGSKGGKATKNLASNFATAKTPPNSENEYEYEIEDENKDNKKETIMYNGASLDQHLAFNAFIGLYPNRFGQTATKKIFLELIINQEKWDNLLLCLNNYKKTEHFRNNKILNLEKFMINYNDYRVPDQNQSAANKAAQAKSQSRYSTTPEKPDLRPEITKNCIETDCGKEFETRDPDNIDRCRDCFKIFYDNWVKNFNKNKVVNND